MKTGKVSVSLLMLAFTFCIISCNKDKDITQNPIPAPVAISADVYVAGAEFNGTVYVAKLWKMAQHTTCLMVQKMPSRQVYM